MSRRLLLTLIALLGLVAAGLLWIGREASPLAGTDSAKASEESLAPAGPAIEADTKIDPGLASTVREGVADAKEESLPPDAVWIEGRVRLPDGTPIDERVEVLLFGEDDAGKDARRAPLGPDGSFRIAVERSRGSVLLDLKSRYAYLPAPVEIDPAKTAPLLLSPRLGGCLHGRLVLPARGLALRASVPGTEVRASASVEPGTAIERQSVVDDALEFELGGLPADRQVWFSVQPADFVAVDVEHAQVKKGRVVELEIELQVGARAAGRVLDEKGAPVQGVGLLAIIQRGDSPIGESSGRATDAEGAFEIAGIKPGKLILEANKEGWPATTLEVGDLEDGEIREGLSIVLAHGLSITGRVQWPGGSPAGGCPIDYQYEVRTAGFREWTRTERRTCASNPDGSFAISGLGPGPVSLTARVWEEAEGPLRGSAHRDEVAPGTEDLVLTLEIGNPVRGRAIDDRGEPLVHFRISAVPADGSNPSEDRQSSVERGFDATEGRFELAGLHAGSWDISAGDEGHARSAAHRVVLPDTGDPLELVLPRNASVAGTVLDPTGSPVAQALVRAETPVDAPRVFGFEDRPDAGVRTDDHGRFLLGEVSPGPHRIVAAAEGFAENAPVQVELQPGDAVRDFVLSLRLGGRIVGEVQDEAGRPIGDRQVSLQGVSVRYFGSSAANASGRFEVENLPPGKYWVSSSLSEKEQEAVEAGSHQQAMAAIARARKRTVANIVEGETTHVLIGGRRAGIRVHGAITSAGEPVGQSIVTVWSQEGNAGMPETTGADDQGRYEITLDTPGTYAFSIRDMERGTSFTDRVAVPAGETFEHDFVLPSGRIAGRVLGPDGAGVPERPVSVRADGRTGELSGTATSGSKTTDEKGAFAVGGLRAGTYRVQVGSELAVEKASKLGGASRAGIVLAEGQSIEGLEIRLDASARIEGSVVGPDGRPIAAVLVTARDEQGNSLNQWPPSTSDASGRFILDGLAPGKVTLMARTKSLAAATGTSVILRAGETNQVELALVPATVLRVLVQEADERWVFASVRIEDERGRDAAEWYSFDTSAGPVLPTPETGIRYGPLPPGRYKVTAMNHDLASVSRDVNLAGEEALTVTLRFGK